MILRRLGNKSKIAKKIQKYFPPHKIYIEPFFGAGGMFFNKPKADYNFLNDNDENVYNCFNVLVKKKTELIEYLEKVPYHLTFWDDCRHKTPDNEIEKAVYFLCLSNFGYMGKTETMKFEMTNPKKILLENIEKTYQKMISYENRFMNFDFREMFKKISYRNEFDKVFIYADPPYIGTTDTYSHFFTEKDSIDLFDCLQETGCKWAMSEFDNEFILQQAKERNLNVHIIGERQNLKNRRTEILITNYKIAPDLFSGCI